MKIQFSLMLVALTLLVGCSGMQPAQKAVNTAVALPATVKQAACSLETNTGSPPIGCNGQTICLDAYCLARQIMARHMALSYGGNPMDPRWVSAIETLWKGYSMVSAIPIPRPSQPDMKYFTIQGGDESHIFNRMATEYVNFAHDEMDVPVMLEVGYGEAPFSLPFYAYLGVEHGSYMPRPVLPAGDKGLMVLIEGVDMRELTIPPVDLILFNNPGGISGTNTWMDFPSQFANATSLIRDDGIIVILFEQSEAEGIKKALDFYAAEVSPEVPAQTTRGQALTYRLFENGAQAISGWIPDMKRKFPDLQILQEDNPSLFPTEVLIFSKTNP